MNKRKFLIGSIGFVFLFSMSHCVKDDVVLKDPQKVLRPWDVNAPLFSLNLRAESLINKVAPNSSIFVDNDGLINFQMDNEYDVPPTNIVDFETRNFSSIHQIKKDTVIYDTIPITINPLCDYDSIWINTGDLMASIGNFPSNKGTYTIRFPGIFLDNGKSFEFTGKLGSAATASQNLSLALMHCVKNSIGFSSYVAETTIKFNSSKTTQGQLQLGFKIDKFESKVDWGYFGRAEVFRVTKNLDMNLFKGLDFSEMVQLKEFKMILDAKNYYGIPFKLKFDTVQFINTTKNEQKTLDFYNSNYLLIDKPNYNTPVVPVHDSSMIDKDNSNIVDGINIGPNMVHFGISVIMNPTDPPQKNFLINNGADKLFFNARIIVPFWFKSTNFNRIDTIGFNISNMINNESTLDYLEYLKLYFDFENGLPFNISTQGYLARENGEIVDSLFSCNGNDCDNTGRRILMMSGSGSNPGIAKIDVVLDSTKVREMYKEKVTQIFLSTRATTGPVDNPDFVKLKEDNYLRMKFDFELKSSTTN